MEYNETDALLEEKIDRKLEEEIQKGKDLAKKHIQSIGSLNKILIKTLENGNVVTKPSFYKLTGSMTLPQRIYDVKKILFDNFRIVSKRGKYNLSHYWLERIKTKTLYKIIWEKL